MPKSDFWPSPGDYSTAIQNPQNCFRDPKLKQGKVNTNTLGLPIGVSGNFAVVYQLHRHPRVFAIRCFIQRVTNQRHRYDALSHHLASFSLPTLVDFTYYPEGIRVRGRRYPLLRMQWVPGKQLHQYVEFCLSRPDSLDQLAARWRGVIAGLRGASMAHGDLQHGNILVDERGWIRLVDYDAFFIPSLQDDPPGEVGHPNYQHPQRTEEGYYGAKADTFSALVIYLSLRALSTDTGLWRTFHTGENLIFQAKDFLNPGGTPVWERLSTSPDAEVRQLTLHLQALCQQDVSALPPLEVALQERLQEPSSTQPTPPPLRIAHAFTFRSGERARTPEQLVSLCERHWDEAKEYLYQDQGFKDWFVQSHCNDLVRVVDRCRREENHSIGLDKFIRSLNPDLGPPEVEISAYNDHHQHFDFLHSNPPDMGIEVHNRGPGCCYGRIEVRKAKWITSPDSRFAVPPGEKQRVRLNIDSHELVWETNHTAQVIVETNSKNAKATAVDFSLSTPRHPVVEGVESLRDKGKWLLALEKLEELDQEGSKARQLRDSIIRRKRRFTFLLAIGDAFLYAAVGALLAHIQNVFILGVLILVSTGGAVGYSRKYGGRYGYLVDCVLGALAPLATVLGLALPFTLLYTVISLIIGFIMEHQILGCFSAAILSYFLILYLALRDAT